VTLPACPSPVAWASLVDYWAHELTPADADAVEEHVFACDTCTERLGGVGALARGIARAPRRKGGMRLMLTPSLVDTLASHGVRMRHYRLQAGESVECAVGADDDLVVSWLRADFAGVERVNATALDANGAPMERFEDVPIDRKNGQVVFAHAGDELRPWPDLSFRMRLVAVDAANECERLLGEYIFHHTAFRAGG
jgi:hypothetical protein